MSREKDCLTFLKIMNDYFRANMSKALIEIYVESLIEYDIDYSKLTKKVLQDIDTREGLPSLKRLIHLAGHGDNLSAENKAQRLIETCIHKARSIGFYRFVKFQRVCTENEHQLIRALGGWSTFCKLDMQNPAIIKRVRDAALLIVQGQNYEKGKQLDLLSKTTPNKQLNENIEKLCDSKEIK